VTNTFSKKQKNKLSTYVSGSTVSTTQYLLLRCDQRIIKKISKSFLDKSASQHQLPGDVIINGAPRKKKRMQTPRLKVWKLREPNVKLEFAQVVAEKKEAHVFETDKCRK